MLSEIGVAARDTCAQRDGIDKMACRVVKPKPGEPGGGGIELNPQRIRCGSTRRPVIRRNLIGAIVAPIALFILTFAVIQNGDGWFTIPDMAYLGVLVAITADRWREAPSRAPATDYGEHAAVTVLFLGLAVWAVANILGNYLFTD
jgi:hypothetical protein